MAGDRTGARGSRILIHQSQHHPFATLDTQSHQRKARRPMSDSSKYKLISAESHVLEPPTLFDTLPAALRDRAPKLKPYKGGSAWFVGDLDPVPLPRTAKTGSGYRQGYPTDGSPISYDDVLPALMDPAERIK